MEKSFGKEFFDIFENTEILDARLDTVTVAEKSGHGVRMDCRISGYVSVACDRCMEPVRIPVDTSALLDLKFGAAEEKTAEDETGREIIRFGNDDTDFDLAQVIYDFLDNSKLFKGTVDKEFRSLMNVPFVTGDADMDAKVVAATKAAGYDNLKGHKSVGGLRASIYNAMPKEGVEALVEFLKKFEAENA